MEKTSFIVIFFNANFFLNRELGERSHLDVNSVFLEAKSFLPTIYHGTQDLNVSNKSSINLIVFKIYFLGSSKIRNIISS